MNIHKNFHVKIEASSLKIMIQEIYSFSIAATINYHKFSSLQQHKFLSFKSVNLRTDSSPIIGYHKTESKGSLTWNLV